MTTTVAVLVSVTPVPWSVPGAAPPSFWVTPNQGSGPIWNAALAGVATMVAVLPVATDAVTVALVDAAPPLIVTEHQSKKFMTVSVTLAPPPSVPPSDPLSAGAPLELLLDPPLEVLLDPPLEPLLDPPLELLLDPPLELPPASSDGIVGDDELLLHSKAPAAANAAIPATPSQPIRFIALMVKASVQDKGRAPKETTP